MVKNYPVKPQTVGEFMKRCRIEHGLTVSELAERSGVHYDTLSSYEGDRSSPSLNKLELLCDTLCVSIDEYVGHTTMEEASK